jgi:dTDP-4-dehydrorhamnose 3,5-epimerase-like enzyme
MIKILDIETHSDARGSLAVIESMNDIPFDIKRIYYLFSNQEGVVRGKHAHKNLKQVYIAISGTCTITFDDGIKKTEIILNSPKQGLFIDGVVWRELSNLSKDCVLLVLADNVFVEDDYIRNYSEFLSYIHNS